MTRSATNATHITLIPIIVFVVFIVGIALTSILNYQHYKKRIIFERETELKTVAQTQSDQAKTWVQKQINNEKEALRHQLVNNILVTGIFIVIMGLLTAWWWWNMRVHYHQRLYNTELSHKALLKKYEFLVKFAYDIIIVADEGMNIVEANYRAQEVFGYSREEMYDMNIFDLHATETLSKIADKISILEEEQAIYFETIEKRKDGSHFSIEFSARMFEIDGEKYYQFIGCDISDRKRAEDELNGIFNLVPDMICLASTDGYFIRLNPAWERTLGFSMETLISNSFINFIHPDDIDSTKLEIQKQVNGQGSVNFINRYITKDSSYKWFEWVSNPSPNGELLFAAARDITARKEAENERETMIRLLRLLNSRNNLQSLSLSILSFMKEVSECECIGIRLKDQDDYPYYETIGFPPEFVMNESCLFAKDCKHNKLVDSTQKPLLECNCGDVISQRFDTSNFYNTPYGSFWTDSISDLVENAPPSYQLTKKRNKCYEHGFESMALIPLHMGGEVFGLIQFNDKQKGRFSLSTITFIEKLCDNIAIAVTQRRAEEDLINSSLRIQRINEELTKAKEKAEESDRLKSAFLANMSHEIRTPMNAIIGFTEILLKPDLSTEKKERFANLIKQRSDDLLRIIEDVLDISKIEVGQMKVVESEVNISLLLNELYEYYRLKKELNDSKAEISLKLLIPHELKNLRIKTDSLRLKQVLNNLLDNALKFTQKGSIEFGCTLESETHLQFFVKDTGIGIPLQKHKLIFDPFSQAEDSVFSRQYGGVGLGLSIVRGMVTLMRGKIWLESKPNEGTTFFFTIAYQKQEGHREPERVTTDGQLVNWKDQTLLVVEDDEINSLCINEMLTPTGIKILNAFNGADALKIFNSEPAISLVLMDIRLPDTTGHVLTTIMKQKRPQLTIIAQTAYASTEDANECIASGCTDYIAKPLSKAKLLTTVGKYIKG